VKYLENDERILKLEKTLEDIKKHIKKKDKHYSGKLLNEIDLIEQINGVTK
jgi:hypothetical protein